MLFRVSGLLLLLPAYGVHVTEECVVECYLMATETIGHHGFGTHEFIAAPVLV